MKKLLVGGFIGLAAGLIAYGVSPGRAGGGDAGGQQGQNSGFQIQPAPQPSNNLMGGGQPMPGAMPGAPGAQPQVQMQPQPTIDIQNYKPDAQYMAWEHIHLDDAKKFSTDPNMLFVDARAKVEYDQGHIPGAIPLPSGEFDKYYEMYKSKIVKAKKLISYCHGIGCKLSEKTAEQLYNSKKHKNVAVFFGGWPQWTQNNLPVEKGGEPGKR